MRTKTRRWSGIAPYSTKQERLDAMIEVIAENTYTGELIVMNDEDDADYLGAEDEIKFLVHNRYTGRTVVFYSAIEAFEYKYNAKV